MEEPLHIHIYMDPHYVNADLHISKNAHTLHICTWIRFDDVIIISCCGCGS